MKLIIVLASAIAMAACSSPPKNPETIPQRVSQSAKATTALVAKLQEANSSIEIEFDADGEWLALAASGTSLIVGSDTVTPCQDAVLQARSAVAQFMSSLMRSSRMSDVISKAVIDDTPYDAKQSATVARKVTNRLSETSSAITRGLKPRCEINGDVAVGIVTVTVADINAARQVSKKMTELMQ